MDPATISLIFAGIRLAQQAVGGYSRSKAALARFNEFIEQLREEDRQPTMEEAEGFFREAMAADSRFASAIERLRAAAESEPT